jgi:hypothetical protein
MSPKAHSGFGRHASEQKLEADRVHPFSGDLIKGRGA